MITDIPMVIFAGGKSSRMGKDKALLPFGGYNSLAQYQFERLNKIFKRVYISAKDDKFDFETNLIKDTTNISSPLVGIASVLQYTKTPTFILSVDAPFIDNDIIQTIVGKHKNFNSIATIASTASQLQPLCGIYHPNILKIAKQHIEENKHSLTKMLKELEVSIVSFTDEERFSNLNYPQEYQKALEKQNLS